MLVHLAFDNCFLVSRNSVFRAVKSCFLCIQPYFVMLSLSYNQRNCLLQLLTLPECITSANTTLLYYTQCYFTIFFISFPHIFSPPTISYPLTCAYLYFFSFKSFNSTVVHTKYSYCNSKHVRLLTLVNDTYWLIWLLTIVFWCRETRFLLL